MNAQAQPTQGKGAAVTFLTADPVLNDGKITIQTGLVSRPVDDDVVAAYVGKTVGALLAGLNFDVPGNPVFFLDDKPMAADHVLADTDLAGLRRITVTRKTGKKG